MADSAFQLIEQTTRHQVYLERLKAGEVNKFASFLKQIDLSLRERLLSVDLTEISRSRMERLLGSVDNKLKGIFEEYQQELKVNLVELAEYESGFEARSLDNVLVNFETVVPAPDQVKAAVFSSPLSVKGADGGKLLDTFIEDFTKTERSRLSGTIRQGFFEGKTNAQLIKDLRGTKVNGFRDGILTVTNRNADAIVRTSVQHVASVARQETWKKNRKVVKKVQWLSTLDSRTTLQCASLDGQEFEFDEGPRPPLHIRCRSTTVPVLDERFKHLEKGGTRFARTPDGKRDSVSAKESYYSWLKKQPAEFQDIAIGRKRAELLRNGGLSSERFAEIGLNRNFTPTTLEEMRRLEPKAFLRAEKASTRVEIVPENQILENAKSYVVQNGRRQGGEFAFAADRKSGRVLVKKKGQQRSVSFTNAEVARLRASSDAELYHNHPSGSSLSMPDLLFAAETDLNKIVAFATRGKGHYEAHTKVDSSILRALDNSVEQYLKRKIQPFVDSRKLSIDQAGHIHQHAFNSILDNVGAIEYRAIEVCTHTENALKAVGKKQFSDWIKSYESNH